MGADRAVVSRSRRFGRDSINLRLDIHVAAKLRALSKGTGLKMTTIVERLIRAEWGKLMDEDFKDTMTVGGVMSWKALADTLLDIEKSQNERNQGI